MPKGCGMIVQNLCARLWVVGMGSTHAVRAVRLRVRKSTVLSAFYPRFFTQAGDFYAQLVWSFQSVQRVVVHSFHRAYIYQENLKKGINLI